MQHAGSALALGLFLSPVSAAPLADLYVDLNGPNCGSATGTQADPYCSVQAAVAAAVAGDTVHIAPGTYVENIVVDKALVLRGTAGLATTILDGGAAGSVIDITGVHTVELHGLTITNGAASSGGGVNTEGLLTLEDCRIAHNSANFGAGVHGFDRRITLLNCVLEDNHASFSGGGAYNDQDSVWIEDSVVRNNTATFSGGAVFLSQFDYTNISARFIGCQVDGNSAARGGVASVGRAVIQVIASTVESNSATDRGGAFYATGDYYMSASVVVQDSTLRANDAVSGGAIYTSRNASIQDSLVEQNVASANGGAVSVGNFLTVRDSLLRDNQAGEDGGAVHFFGSISGACEIERSTIQSNSADGDGGGVWADLTDDNWLDLIDSTLRANTALGDGGGLYVYDEFNGDGVAFLENSTLSGNQATRGGGLFVEGNQTQQLVVRARHLTISDNTATLIGGGVGSCFTDGVDCVAAPGPLTQFENSIVAGNHAPLSLDLTGLYESQGGNLIGIGKGNAGFEDGLQGDQVGSLDAPLNAGLAPLFQGTDPTATHALLAGSPALNAALDAPDCLPTDQLGQPRPFGPGCDVGAYESYSTATLIAFGSGIAGTGGETPTLSGLGSPVPGGSFTLSVENGLGGGVGAILLGSELAPPLPLFGGSLYASALLTFPSVLAGAPGAAGEGAGSQPVLVPNVPALIGSTFAAQAGYFDPGAAQGISLSNAVRILIGS